MMNADTETPGAPGEPLTWANEGVVQCPHCAEIFAPIEPLLTPCRASVVRCGACDRLFEWWAEPLCISRKVEAAAPEAER